ncbi:MAG: hypothetical protein ABIY70_20700, partial [Capsulimonas sp.]|uniref:hypothetical protein n=1 Tax=Capsulimonas sp. TaxID=2494211 RepID=UPI0032635CA3
MNIVTAPQTVIGFHGCDHDIAERLLDGLPFHTSTNDYDWLGSGIYFWEYAPYRAWDWARQRHGARAAVLCAEISLGDCLNLLDTNYFADLQAVHAQIISTLEEMSVAPPENSRGANRLDRFVLDEFNKRYASRAGFFDTVRGCFPEGLPLYKGSKLLSR